MKNHYMFLWPYAFATSLLVCQFSRAQEVPLGEENLVNHLDQELSGEIAKRNLEYISRLHRMRGSEDYNQAIAFIETKLGEYQLEDIEVIDIPTDGTTLYGTQKSRPAWNPEYAELWEMKEKSGQWIKADKIADYQAIPLVLAQDSQSAEVSGELVAIGEGTQEEDYATKSIAGKLVLTSSQPEDVVSLAVAKYGAAGIISYAQNQVTAWWKENENLIRWGHLDTFSKTPSFAFMVSLKQARSFEERLTTGENIRLHAKVIAEHSPGSYKILKAEIKGADPGLEQEAIAFTCHLDHPRPGANDNASGCMAILEVARTLKKLIASGEIERPARSLLFIWSPEIEGTTALLNFRSDLAEKIKFNIHMDMVGGGPETKAVFHVSRSPQSLPSFVNAVGEAFGDFVNKTSNAYAAGEEVNYPITAPEGGKEPLQALLGEFHMGSDFQVYNEGSFRIPSIYLHDWPDRYIHTNYDLPAHIDPTKLKRAAFIGAASGYCLSNLQQEKLPLLIDLLKQQVLTRASRMLSRTMPYPPEEQENAKFDFWLRQQETFNSLMPFVTVTKEVASDYKAYLANLKKALGEGMPKLLSGKDASIVFSRNPRIKGPMTVFGYDYFADHYGKEQKMPALLSFNGIYGSGPVYCYEALNLVNGVRSVMEIRNALSAEFGPVPLEDVAEYLWALEKIGVLSQK